VLADELVAGELDLTSTIVAFAGDDISVARFFPEDDSYIARDG